MNQPQLVKLIPQYQFFIFQLGAGIPVSFLQAILGQAGIFLVQAWQ
jgi:hypothetical protein